MVLWPCRCRRGGAYSLINTPVTRVKPPQARAALATPRQRGQERGRRLGLARRPDSPKLPAKPSIFREKSGSGAGGLREAPRTLRASVRVFTAETSRAASVPAEPPAGSAGPQTEDPPLRCGPKEQKWPREERDEPRSCRRTDRRACAFPTPPALAARASPGGAGGGGGSRSLRRLGFQSRCFLFRCCSAVQRAPRAITCARRSPCQSALEHL